MNLIMGDSQGCVAVFKAYLQLLILVMSDRFKVQLVRSAGRKLVSCTCLMM